MFVPVLNLIKTGFSERKTVASCFNFAYIGERRKDILTLLLRTILAVTTL